MIHSVHFSAIPNARNQEAFALKLHKPRTHTSPGHAALLASPQDGSGFTAANPSTTRAHHWAFWSLTLLRQGLLSDRCRRPAREGDRPEHGRAPPLRERATRHRPPCWHGRPDTPSEAVPAVLILQHTHRIGARALPRLNSTGTRRRAPRTPGRHSPYWELCAGSSSLPVTLVGNVHQADLVHPKTATV